MVDPGFINSIVQTFHDTLLPIAAELVGIVEPSIFIMLKLAFVVFLASVLMGGGEAFLNGVLLFLLGLGFCHVVLTLGYQWAGQFFAGAAHLSEHFGAPASNPSAILALGIKAATPLLTSVSDGGLLSYVRHPTSIIFLLAGLGVLAAFAILSFVMVAMLLWSYVLIAVAPLAALFSPLPILRGVALSWASQVMGTTMGLFVVGLMAATAQRIGAEMAASYAAAFVPGTSYGWEAYLHPLAVSFLLAAVYGYVPLKFSRAAAQVSGDIIAGAGQLFSKAGAAASLAATGMTIPSKGSGSSSPTGGGGGGGKSSGGSSGASLPPAQAPRFSAWQ